MEQQSDELDEFGQNKVRFGGHIDDMLTSKWGIDVFLTSLFNLEEGVGVR